MIDRQTVRHLTIETTSRYINFLETIIGSDSSSAASIELLWGQELMFIFSTLIAGGLQEYMLGHILPKVHAIRPVYLHNMIPFLLTNQITTVTPEALELLVEECGPEAAGRLVLGLRREGNDPDLPHQLNNCLVRAGMWLELVELNIQFGDHYTPVAMLTSQCMSEECSPALPQLLAYCLYETLLSANLKRLSRVETTQTLLALLPLLQQHALRILALHQPTALYTLVLPELYSHQCLEALNQLSLTPEHKSIMTDVVRAIP